MHPSRSDAFAAGPCLLAAAVMVMGCRSSSDLWERHLAEVERTIDAEVAQGPASPSQAAPDSEHPDSMVARLRSLGQASDVEQARMIERGITAAVAAEAGGSAPPDPVNGPGPGIARIWGLAELAAAALEANPSTRQSWQRARAAAAREQSALAAYGPQIGIQAGADYFQQPGQALGESTAPPDREFRFTPQVYASWLLLDFGRRDADTERARAELAAANLSHDRTIQRTVFEVQSAYFRLEGSLGLRTAAEQDLVSARSVLRATEARLKMGLATRPETLLARQAYAEAMYQLEKRRAEVFVAEGDLRTRVGFPASIPLPIDATPETDVPEILLAGVDGIIDQALARRPDLAAAVLEVRAREAEVRRAQAEFLPELVARGSIGGDFYDYNVEGFNIQGDGWGFAGAAFLGGRWLLYDAGARDAALAEAVADRAAAAASLAKARLDAADQVWRSYYTLQSDRARYDAAKAQLVAAIDTFEAVKRSYELGLSTLPELLEAESDLSVARAQRIESRSDVLRSSAALIFASGDGPGQVGTLR